MPDPLAATTLPRRTKLPPTSDRIPGSAPSSDLLQAHKSKQGVRATEAMTPEMSRKARQIAPPYNKGALQYLPGGQKDSGPQEPDKGPPLKKESRKRTESPFQ